MAPFKTFYKQQSGIHVWRETLIEKIFFLAWKIKSFYSSSDQTVNSGRRVTWNNVYSLFLIKNNVLVENTHLTILLNN